MTGLLRSRAGACIARIGGLGVDGSVAVQRCVLSAGFQCGGVACHGVSGALDTPVIRTRGLVKRYGDLVAVDGVDLTIPAGDVYGLLGPNGAGKTTLMRMLFGLIRPDDGTIELFGRAGALGKVDSLRDVAGFVETPRFY